MKAFYLAMLFLSLNVGFGLLSYTEIFGDISLVHDDYQLSAYSSRYQNLQAYTPPIEDDTEFKDDDADDTNMGVSLWETIKISLLPNVLLNQTFGINYDLALLLSIPIYLVYIIAIAQLFRGVGGVTAL